MKIDKKLNLVSTINRDGALPIYLHVLPFPYEVVEEHCFLLGNMFNSFITQVGNLGSVRVAAMMLRKALSNQEQEKDKETQTTQPPSIIDEIQRLTNVVYNDGDQWKTAPLEVAFKQGIIEPDEYREVEGEVVFFMVSSAIQKRNLLKPTVGAVIGMYGGQLTVSSVTEFRDSLQTSNPSTDTQTQNVPQETSFIPS